MRKISLLFVLLLMALPLGASAQVLKGDVNGDGKVRVSDVAVLINYLLSGDPTGVNLENADVYEDGKINIHDVTELINILLTTPDELQTETITVNGVTFKMVPVEGGTFMMGAPDDDPDADEWEKPAHQVTLSSYYIGETEVTQELWLAVMGNNPSHFQGDLNRPVEGFWWQEIQEFITKLNELTGRSFRLPTEAEWEYAARGGNKSHGYKYSGSQNIDEVAWYGGNSDDETHPVAIKVPNELGLYDMSGNVSEFCQDWWGSYSSEPQTNPTGPATGEGPVSRGGQYGGWSDDDGADVTALGCPVWARSYGLTDLVLSGIGLRLALDVESSPQPQHEYVDLGLPSGTLWATCNVGANSPEEYGDYFAWGETEPKEVYTWENYKWCNGTFDSMIKYCIFSKFGTVDNKTVLDLDDDAAYVNWGVSWRMPSWDQMEELRAECTWTWTTLNGINGRLVTGPNGNTLFLPAAGVRSGSELYDAGSEGLYWGCELYPYADEDFDETPSASEFWLDSNHNGLGGLSNLAGACVRPVRVP